MVSLTALFFHSTLMSAWKKLQWPLPSLELDEHIFISLHQRNCKLWAAANIAIILSIYSFTINFLDFSLTFTSKGLLVTRKRVRYSMTWSNLTNYKSPEVLFSHPVLIPVKRGPMRPLSSIKKCIFVGELFLSLYNEVVNTNYVTQDKTGISRITTNK